MLGEIIEANAPIETWFGVGGGADTLARPRTEDELVDVLRMFAGQKVRVLGEGANLLVHDDGVDGLVVSLERMRGVDYHGYDIGGSAERRRAVTITAQAGANLPKLVVESVRLGLSGLENFGGIPASVGGAIAMNAGGAFGSIEDVVECVRAVTQTGERLEIPHDELDFGYRRSGLEHLIITSVDFNLVQNPDAQQDRIRQRLKDVMAYKKDSQPLAERSAGCVFKNPTIRGARMSAGMLIDEAGCKGLRVGGATVSNRHANFIVAEDGASAADVIELIERVRERVGERHDVQLEPEVVIWRRANARQPAGSGA
jgi:UDP-N-acetylmuramate dehydrogenase